MELPFEIQCEILIYSHHFRRIAKAFNNGYAQQLFKKHYDQPIKLMEIKSEKYIRYILEEDCDDLPKLTIEIVNGEYPSRIILCTHHFMGYQFTHYSCIGYNKTEYNPIYTYYDIETTIKVYQSRHMKLDYDMTLLEKVDGVWDQFEQLIKIWTVYFEWHAHFGFLYDNHDPDLFHDYAEKFDYRSIDYDKIKLDLDYENKKRDLFLRLIDR